MNTTGSLEQPTDERFHKYTLTSLLPDGQVLITDARLLVMTVVEEGACMPVAQEQLTEEESLMFDLLLSHHPYYCPYEDLYARFYRRTQQEASDALQLADTPTRGTMMRPIRNLISRTRFKVRPLGLDFRSMIETGYMLIPSGKGIQ